MSKKGIDSFLNQADLKSIEKKKKTNKKELVNFALRLPKEFKEAIQDNSMSSINSYILEAIKSKLKEDNYI